MVPKCADELQVGDVWLYRGHAWRTLKIEPGLAAITVRVIATREDGRGHRWQHREFDMFRINRVEIMQWQKRRRA
jgi:hypothetical protein